MFKDVLPIYPDHRDLVYGFIDGVGEAFALGAAGGAAFHFARGLIHSSPGGRLVAGFRAARAGAPRVAGKFGVFCAAFSALEAATYLARGGEYSFTGSAAAFAATCGLQGMRRGGGPAAAGYAFLGGACVLVLEELSWAKMVSDFEKSLARQRRMHGDRPAPAALRPKPDGCDGRGPAPPTPSVFPWMEHK